MAANSGCVIDTLCDMWEPVGPLPAAIYWRRRSLAVAAVAAVIAVVLGGAMIGDGPALDDVPAPEPVAQAQDGPAEPVVAPPVAEPSAPTCTNDMIDVAAEIDRSEHRVGQQPVLRLVVTNVTAQPCLRDLDPARQEIVVWGQDLTTRLWSSNDCGNPSTPDPRTLQPNQPLGFRVPWTGRTTTPGCGQERTIVPPGSYQVTTRVDDAISEPRPFRRLP